jgi:transcriptional regulator with XRE-family HTH domain
MTQEDTASAAHVSRKTLSDFENGSLGITLGNLLRLMNAVGLDLATREASPRPTADELADAYRIEEHGKTRHRARRKNTT